MKEQIKELIPYVAIIVIVILIKSFIVTPIRVIGDSMDPTLKNHNMLILNKLDKSYERFDIVIIKFQKEKIVKRVIGLPGDRIKYVNNELYVNDKLVKEEFNHSETYDFTLDEVANVDVIPKGYYLVLGDNRVRSYDSRAFGLIKKEDIEGVVSFRIWPFNKFGKIS